MPPTGRSRRPPTTSGTPTTSPKAKGGPCCTSRSETSRRFPTAGSSTTPRASSLTGRPGRSGSWRRRPLSRRRPSRGRPGDDGAKRPHRGIAVGPLVPGELDLDGQPPHRGDDRADAEAPPVGLDQAGRQRGDEVGGGDDGRGGGEAGNDE